MRWPFNVFVDLTGKGQDGIRIEGTEGEGTSVDSHSKTTGALYTEERRRRIKTPTSQEGRLRAEPLKPNTPQLFGQKIFSSYIVI